MSRVTPVVTMRVYPTPASTLYARVLIFGTKRAMVRYGKRHGHTGKYRAACDTQVKPRAAFAELLFHEGDITIELLTHECLHAVLGYARRLRFDLSALACPWRLTRHDTEERLVEVHSMLTHELVVALRKRGWVL